MADSKGGGGTVHDVVIDLVAGSLAAVALVYVGQPFDTLKVKMQTFPENYSGTWHCLKETMAKEGVRGLYAGTVSAIAANVAENAVLFSGYGLCQKAIGWTINQNPEQLGVLENATAGSVASFFSSFTLCPPELIKCRAQALRELWERDQPRGHKGQFHVSPMVLVRSIVKEDGPTGLFRGLASTLMREVPGYFFFFGGYELTREILAPPGVEKKDIGALRTMAAGAVGGAVFWLVMFPIDVVKSRIQVEGVREPMFRLLAKIGRKEGISTGSMDIPPNKRPNCSYGDECYRRNPIHLREYCHPHLEALLQGQQNSSNLVIPEGYKPKLEKELILDQLNVLKRIYEKFADKPPIKKSKIETTSNVSAKSSDVSQPSMSSKILSNTLSIDRTHNFPRSSSDQSSRSDGVRTNIESSGSSSVLSETSSERASSSSVSSQNDGRRFDNFKNMKQKCRDLKRKSMAETEKNSKSPFSSDIPARIAAAAPYYFFLTKVRAEPKTYHEPLSITFRELLDPGLGKLRASLQINFLVELPWVMHHYEHQGVNDKPLLILHGEDSEDLKKSKLPPNITAVRIKTPHPFGHHHTKMSLFHYEDGSLRVVVSTANLVASDWHNRTQGLWVSPACPELPEDADTKAGDSLTEFKTDLLRYLTAYQIPELQEWVSIVRRTDFSDIRVCFIGTVPGTHRGPDMDRWGHRRLATFLKKHAVGVDSTWSVVAQCSSIGSLGTHPEAWMLDELRASMTLGKGTSMIQGLPPFKVIYPSKQNVYDSVDGALGGDCLPYSVHTHTKQTWFTSFLYQWKSNIRFRTGAVPHIKTYTRMSPCGSQLAWFHLSSANLSKAAWGMNKKTKTSGSGVFMMSYEAGVLFLPEILIKKPVFSVGKSGDKIPPFPLPYDVPLTRYTASDKPWVMEYLNEYMRSKR